MKTGEIIKAIEVHAPPEFQADWDNCGVQVAGTAEVDKLAVCLDPTLETISRCLDWGAQFVLSHHPFGMKPRLPDRPGEFRDTLKALLMSDATLYSAHTSLDVQISGPVSWLLQELGVQKMSPLEQVAGEEAVRISFKAEPSLDKALAEKWAESGLLISIGQDSRSTARLVCLMSRLDKVLSMLALDLGYEPLAVVEPAPAALGPIGFGAVGDLPKPIGLQSFISRILSLTGRKAVSLSGDQPENISRVAVCPGSGSGLALAALKAGADVFITGDMKYHQALEAPLPILDVGHFSLEEEMMRRLSLVLAQEFGELGVEVEFFTGRDPFGFFCV